MPFAIVTAADESRIDRDRDCLRIVRRLCLSSGLEQLLACFECLATQRLVVYASLDRQQVPQHIGGNTIGHKRREMCPQFIKFRR